MGQAEIDSILAAAAQANRAGQRAQAAALLRSVLDGSGEHPVALNALGVQALDTGDAVGAAALFRRAQAVDTSSPELPMNLAKALRLSGDGAGEQAALEAALAIDRRHFMALVRLAELFERKGDQAAAANRWSEVLAMAAIVDQPTPALQAMFEHARQAVGSAHSAFAEIVDASIAQARAGLSPEASRRFDSGIDHMLGRRRIYVNECAGLHFPFLPADEFFDRKQFPWFGDIEAKTDVIRTELQALLETGSSGFHPYIEMESGVPDNKWSPLDHKLDWSAFHLWKNGERDDSACAQCPQTAAAIEALPIADIPGRAPTVFFSLLRPGTHLPAHTGVSNVRTIVHLPLIVPAGCSFRVGGETREWRVGEAWAFDDTIEHEAWNRSDELRALLIFDVWNPYITEAERGLLRAFFPVADENSYGGRSRVSD